MQIRPLKYYILIIYGIFFCYQPLLSQTVIDKNLVPNGSFENFRKKSGAIKAAIPWTQMASVDYYQEPIANDTSRLKGARTGSCYAGLRFQKNYKEFMQVKLAEPLHRGYKYQFEMYIRLGFWSNALLKSMGAHFSKAGFGGVNTVAKSNTIDSICKKGGFDNGYQWIKISGIYQADGGEKYLTIGNFSNRIGKDMIRLNKFKLGFREAYYFVDDVSLKWIKPKEEEVKTVIVGSENDAYGKDSVLQVKKDIKVGEKVTLNNINFEKGHSYITTESFPELNKLVKYMLLHPTMEIRINGHSDNSGSPHKNQKLSEQRARAVFEYLISKGVQNKMYFKGFGNQQPISGNDTEEGKAKNRRVEFEIIKE
ncbi:MAG: OmpA family protein [Bacteroidia bacterium]